MERAGLGRCKLLYIGWINSKILLWASLVAQMVKNPPAVQETWVQSLGCKDPVEKEMATDSSILGASLVAQMVKNLPAMQESEFRSLGQEDPWEKGMTTHSSILIWRISWTEEPGRLQSMGLQSQKRLSN